MQPRFSISALTVAMTVALTASQTVLADDLKKGDKVETITIIGDNNAAQKVPGSAHVVSETELEEFKYTDVNRALQQVPGVYIQLEDGLGLRPNIGIRGTGTGRSSRVTLMEDGVLIAPAPYAASAAYYFPTFDRITGIEVLKGPAAIKYGPFTVGGAVNLISRQIPVDAQGQLKLEVGENNERRGYVYYGDSSDNFGYLLEANKHVTDGFKTIDRHGDETGFDKEDYVAKFRFNNDYSSDVYQQLDIKIQHSTEDSDQSYLGLTDADFAANPYRMYGVSALDTFAGEHDQYVLSYYADLTDSFDLRVTAYRNETARNWYKTGAFIMGDPLNPGSTTRYSWSNIFDEINTGGANAAYFQSILDGADAPDDRIEITDNNRNYVSQGVQASFEWDFTVGEAQHDLQLGLRVHEDEEDRFQRHSYFIQENGTLVFDQANAWGTAGNRVSSAKANSYYLVDTITYGDWIFTPGVRYEDVELKREDWANATDRSAAPGVRTNSVSEVLPGFGALWLLSDNTSLLFGVNKGFAPPGNSPNDKPEESWNYEMGVRFAGETYNSELIAFYSDYDNLLGECTLANSGCSIDEIGDRFNGGAAKVKGLELRVVGELAENWLGSVSYTYTDTEFASTFNSNVWGPVENGQPIPYIPENQVQVSFGYDNSEWNIFTNLNYVDGTCTKPACGEFQQTDSRFIVDLASEFDINDSTSIYATIDNLLDDDSIVAREPYGARPDKPRTARVGVKFNF